jgi:hypothetical protein
LLNLLERRLVKPHSTVIIPLDDRVLVVGLLNCAEVLEGARAVDRAEP